MIELELGIDDAGRGPVVGPMVLAGCLIDKKIAPKLKRLGVRDSKELTQKRRVFLSDKIKEVAETFEIVLAYPKEIDGKLHDGTNLNLLEAIKTAEIINKINKGYKHIKVIVDCPSVGITKWCDFLKTKIKNLSNLEVVCEHKADKNYVSVSAASILAKVIREKEMSLIKEKFGKEIGSGYSSDHFTQEFIKKNAIKHKNKGIFRKSWITWRRVSAENEQRKLSF